MKGGLVEIRGGDGQSGRPSHAHRRCFCSRVARDLIWNPMEDQKKMKDTVRIGDRKRARRARSERDGEGRGETDEPFVQSTFTVGYWPAVEQ